jgi:glutamate-1-semialdehyde 2,1-aminomutase
VSTTETGRSTTRSRELYARAQEHLAGGVGSGTRSPRAGWVPVPIFVESGQGSRLRDVDGNEYVDWAMGLGPLILGHRPPAVIEAVTRVLQERGSMVAFATDLEGQAADAISARVPSMELLRLGNSGTECVQYAMRFARAATGRDLILRFEGHYHGWSDAAHWSAHPDLAEAGPADAPMAVPSSTGIPAAVGQSLLICPWNDAGAVERLFADHGDRIAAVITEPIMGNCGGLMPEAGYLERLRDVAHEHGALLIFDEVLTGLRVGPAGAQGLLGVEPDLTVLAKALAAGFPVAAVGGSRRVMDMVAEGRTMHGGTYNSSPLACAAVIAAMAETGRPGFYEELDARGERMAEGLVSIVREAGLPACWSGTGGLFQLWFAERPPREYRSAQAIVATSPFPVLQAELLERRVIVQPPQEGLFLPSGAHTDADVERTLEATAQAMPAVVEAVESGRVGPRGGVR